MSEPFPSIAPVLDERNDAGASRKAGQTGQQGGLSSARVTSGSHRRANRGSNTRSGTEIHSTSSTSPAGTRTRAGRHPSPPRPPGLQRLWTRPARYMKQGLVAEDPGVCRTTSSPSPGTCPAESILLNPSPSRAARFSLHSTYHPSASSRLLVPAHGRTYPISTPRATDQYRIMEASRKDGRSKTRVRAEVGGRGARPESDVRASGAALPAPLDEEGPAAAGAAADVIVCATGPEQGRGDRAALTGRGRGERGGEGRSASPIRGGREERESRGSSLSLSRGSHTPRPCAREPGGAATRVREWNGWACGAGAGEQRD